MIAQTTLEDERAQRLAPVLNVLGVVFSLGWTVAYWALGYPPLAVASLGLCTVSYIWRSVRLRQDPTRITAFFRGPLVTLWLALFTTCWYTGGIVSGAMLWYILVPFLAFVMRDEAFSKVLLVVTCLGLFVMGGLQALGWVPEPYLPHQLLQQLGSSTTACATVFIGTLSYAKTHQKAIDHLRDSRDALIDEVQDHRNTRVQLEQAQDQLVNAAHLAGMAEVATGVLHNVGNGMNGVNVSATLIADRLNHPADRRLDDVIALLQAPDCDAQQRQKLAAYLTQWVRNRERHREGLAAELNTLRAGIDHVKAIVQAQQSVARSAGHVAPITAREAVERALTLIRPSLQRNGIESTLDIPSLKPLVIDPHKLLQILGNLLANARDALRDHDGQRTLHIQVTEQINTITITVTDSGPGISAEHLERIFGHGFTTKPAGHGFGLHISAIAARELGGSLSARSDGPGTGATFSLTVPRSHRSQATA